MSDHEAPEFGPRGYLPERAARRARKIVLRAPLGLGWIVGSLAVGVVVVVAGVLWLTADDAPGEAWVEVGPAAEVTRAGVDGSLDVLLVGNGRVRAFADAGALGLGYCEASGHVEAPDGRVWTRTGRGLDGTESLTEHPTLVRDGLLYVDPERTSPAPAPTDEPAEPACH